MQTPSHKRLEGGRVRAQNRESEPLPGDSAFIKRFAEAIVKPGGNALLLDRENKSIGWISISRAVRSRKCFSVEVADRIFACDADNAPIGHYLESILAPELIRLKLKPVVLRSGRDGHRHLFCAIDNVELKTGLTATAKKNGVDVRRSIRPPLTPHRLGLPVALVYPKTIDAALRSLQKTGGIERGQAGLSNKMSRILQFGDEEKIYRSRSEVCMALMIAMLNAGWSEELIHQAFLNKKNIGGEKIRESRETYFKGEYLRAKQFVANHPTIRKKADAIELVDRIEAIANQTMGEWKGRSGATARAVLQAFITVARQSGSVTFDAGRRQLMRIAGIGSPATFYKAVRRLFSWVDRVESGSMTKCTRWRLRAPGGGTNELQSDSQDSGVPSIQTDEFSKDAFRYGALGKTAVITLAAFSKIPVTTCEVANRLCISVDAARSRLKTLKRAGLVKAPKGKWIRIERNLQKIARQRGTSGVGARQKQLHEHEFENHVDHLSSYGYPVHRLFRKRAFEVGAGIGDVA